MGDFNPEHQNALSSQVRRLNGLRIIAAAQAARVTSREPGQESERRWAIVNKIDGLKKRLKSWHTPRALNAQLDAIAEKLETTQQKDDASADPAVRRAMAEWMRYERDQTAKREATQAPVRSQLHTLLKQICQRKTITISTWLRDHHIDRSQYYAFKKAGGKPVEGEVPVVLAGKIKAAILRDAGELGLEVSEDLLEVGAVHDNVHDV